MRDQPGNADQHQQGRAEARSAGRSRRRSPAPISPKTACIAVSQNMMPARLSVRVSRRVKSA